MLLNFLNLLFATASVGFWVEGILQNTQKKPDLKRYPETIQSELQDVKRLIFAVGVLIVIVGTAVFATLR